MRCGSPTDRGGRTPAARLSPFALLAAAWLAANLVGRWLAWTLFHGHGPYGWPRPGIGELVLLCLCAVLPALFAGVLVDLAGRLAPRRVRAAAAFLCALALAVWAEFDASWLHLSRTHIGWREVLMFVSENWSAHFGLRGADFVRTLAALGGHAAVLAGCAWISLRLRRQAPEAGLPLAPALVVLALLWPLEAWHVARQRALASAQWIELTGLHPLRPGWLDGAFRGRPSADLAAAQAELARVRASAGPDDDCLGAHQRTPLLPGAERIDDVVLVVVESWNPAYVDESTMPRFSALRADGLALERHHSTGNCTHHGVLGLLFGAPVTFYGRGDPPLQSAWIDAFAEAGFVTRYIGSDLTSFRHMGAHMANFAKPHVEAPADELLDALTAELAAEERSLIVLFYGATHFPWRHDPRYARFQPETPEEFDYSAWNVRDHVAAIRNRYRNALGQLDDWLAAVVDRLDRERTLLLVTGDHGQEFFERGRLAHGSALTAPQLRTPALFLAPGLPAGSITGLTSHADLLPTVAAWLGLEIPGAAWDPLAGRALSPCRAGGSGLAVASHNAHVFTPVRWAVLSDERKLELAWSAAGGASLSTLVDLDDQPLAFDAEDPRWATALHAALDLERALQRLP